MGIDRADADGRGQPLMEGFIDPTPTGWYPGWDRYEYTDNDIFGGPYDGGVAVVDSAEVNLVMFPFGNHLGAGQHGHCAGIFHVYLRRLEPVMLRQGFVYEGAMTKREFELRQGKA